MDLGPEGRINGGTVIAEGTPEDIRSNAGSVTGIYMKMQYVGNTVLAKVGFMPPALEG